MRADLAQIEPRDFTLTAKLWRAAATLGGLRCAVNDRIRASSRDRGEMGNRDNDISGSLSELVGLLVLEECGATGIAHSLLDLYEPIAGVDAVGCFSGSEEPFSLEVKSHLLKPHYKNFLINEKAHARSRERKAEGYLPVVTRLQSGVARVGRVIPMGDVGRSPWDSTPRSLGRHSDPAWMIRLEPFAGRYLAGKLEGSGSQTVLSDRDIVDAYNQAKRGLTQLRAEKFSLKGRTPSQVIEVLTSTSMGVIFERDL